MRTLAAVIPALRLPTGTAEVLASLRRSLSGDGVTAPLPPQEPERAQTLAMLQLDQPVTEPDAAAIVATSGSTGHPRGVVLSAAALRASADATHARLNGPGTWVLALPPHYVAGLMVLVRGVVADQPVHEVDSHLQGLTDLEWGSDPAYLSVVPTQLARALADPALTRALTRFDAVLLGGAAADASLLHRAGEAGIAVVTTYGMSETCGGCVYDGQPLDGVTVTTSSDGRVSIGGPTLFSGYRLDPATTAEALVDGRLVTRDRGALDQGRLTVLGRLDDVVISGGMNVDLATVERAVRAWAAGEAAVVGLPSAEWGVEVVAVVEQPDEPPESDARLGDLRASLSHQLPTYALPRRLLIIPALPRTSGGKIDRRRLVADLAVDTERE